MDDDNHSGRLVPTSSSATAAMGICMESPKVACAVHGFVVVCVCVCVCACVCVYVSACVCACVICA